MTIISIFENLKINICFPDKKRYQIAYLYIFITFTILYINLRNFITLIMYIIILFNYLIRM